MDIAEIDKSQVTEYCERGGNANLEFADGSHLVMIPYRNWDNIEGFDSAVLYQNGTLEALATDRRSRYSRTEESGFWSKGTVPQQQLAAYMAAAAQIGLQVYNDYNEKKIDEDAWRDQFWEFWIITTKAGMLRESLEAGSERVFDKNPGRFSDTI